MHWSVGAALLACWLAVAAIWLYAPDLYWFWFCYRYPFTCH